MRSRLFPPTWDEYSTLVQPQHSACIRKPAFFTLYIYNLYILPYTSHQPLSASVADVQLLNASPTFGRHRWRNARASPSFLLGRGVNAHCTASEHFPFLHPGWDQAQLQEDKGRWRRVMQEFKEEETQPDKSYLGNSPKAIACRRGDEQLLTMQWTWDPPHWEEPYGEQNLRTLFHEANYNFAQVMSFILYATLILKSQPTFAVSGSYKCAISQTPPEREGWVNRRVFPALPRKPVVVAEADCSLPSLYSLQLLTS